MNKKGFTLIELITTFALASILIILLIVFILVLSVYNTKENKKQVFFSILQKIYVFRLKSLDFAVKICYNINKAAHKKSMRQRKELLKKSWKATDYFGSLHFNLRSLRLTRFSLPRKWRWYHSTPTFSAVRLRTVTKKPKNS